MAFTVSDFEDLVGLLAQHPEWRERLRPLVLGDELLAVPSRMDRVEAVVADLALRTAENTSAIQALTVAVDRLVERMDWFEGRMGNIEGQLLESRYERNMVNWLGQWFWPVQPLYLDDLPEFHAAVSAGTVTLPEATRLRRADLLFRGNDRTNGGTPVLVVGEVSYTINLDDVRRADERATTLRRLGYETRALVGGYRITDVAETEAERLRVLIDLHRPEAQAS